MELEIISRVPAGTSARAPLLFVHGAFCGAWVWDEHFLPYFAEHGYPAYALSLRGHGASEGPDYLHYVSLTDYVDDLNEVVMGLDATPVLIGHSLGGVVVQKWLKRHSAPGAVLLGSGPPHGMLPPLLGMLCRDPVMVAQIALAQAFGPRFASEAAVRKALFSDGVPDHEVNRHLARGSAESLRVGLELICPDFPSSVQHREQTVLVLGAANDFFVSPTMVDATAHAYGTHAEIFPDMSHAMMLEPGWQTVADRILQWLQDKVFAVSTTAH